MDNYCITTMTTDYLLQDVTPVSLEIYTISTTTSTSPLYVKPCNTIFDSPTLYLFQFFLLFIIFYTTTLFIFNLSKKTI